MPPTTPDPEPEVPEVPTNPGVPPTAADCPAFPSNPTLATQAKLNDPFTKLDGTKVTTKDAWTCRAEEISQLFQRHELGTLPAVTSVTGSLSGNNLNIQVSAEGKSISFSVGIKYPSSGSAPWPAIIAYGAASIPVPNNVAVITFNNDQIAAQQSQSSRGSGLFYNLYGSSHSAGALMAWAWGVGRIIDAIETTANIRLDPKKLGVTGCSRNGKGAIVAGAFNPRIALTIPQESGSGGAACWRLSDDQKARGINVQTASQIITENVWFSTLFNPYVNGIPRLPVDHHMLAGLVAPRGLIIIENTSMEWLGNESAYGCMVAGRKIYQALGVADNMGISQSGHGDHCGFPGAQQPELTAFINKFLLGQTSANTNVVKTDGNFKFNEANWIPWSTPTLT